MADEPQEEVQPGPDRGRLAAGVAITALGVLLLLDHAGVIDWGPYRLVADHRDRVRRGATGRGWPRRPLRRVLGLDWRVGPAQRVRRAAVRRLVALVIGDCRRQYGARFVRAATRSTTQPIGPPCRENGAALDRRAADLDFHHVLVRDVPAGPIWGAQLSGRAAVTQATETADTVHRAAIMGQTRSVSQASAFHGGDLTAIMGQCELDLTHATIAPGETPVVNVFVLMGEVTLRVPKDWIVDARAVPAIGQVRDSRTASDTPAASIPPGPPTSWCAAPSPWAASPSDLTGTDPHA